MHPSNCYSGKEETMAGTPIVAQFARLRRWLFAKRTVPYDLHYLWLQPNAAPRPVADSAAAMRLLALFGPLDWSHLPERNLQRNWGHLTVPYTALILACLIKISEGKNSMGQLRQYLVENPELAWLCGFRPAAAPNSSPQFSKFDVDATLPTQRHLTRMLRELPNALLQYLISDSIRLIYAELARQQVALNDVVATR
jgi:hypothetical protein